MNTLTFDELKRMNEQEHQDFVLINVLPREKFIEDHIRTSVNVPVEDEEFVDIVAKIAGSKDRRIVVYCANFNCDASPRAAKKLEDAGFARIYDYEGGTREWNEQKQAA